jgi:hypothetical protein
MVGIMEPRNFNLFGPCKKLIEGKQFLTDADVKQAVTSWLQTPDTHFFNAAIHATVEKLLKCRW